MLTRAVSQAVARLGLRGRSVLVAVSGGLDSVALLHVLHELAEEYGLKLSIGHVNHGLRGEQSEADEAFVGDLGRALGLPVRTASVAPREARAGRSSRERPTLQEAARTLRYAALRELARDAGAECVVTAHHADDQAETVLLRVLRGSGPDGLGGIPERSPDGCLRPLLRVPRREIEAFARERRLTWREDASNRDPRYARNRLRERWLPELAREFNPRLLRSLAHLAEAHQRDREWIAQLVEREAGARFRWEEPWLIIDAGGWPALPVALSRRLARRALELQGAGRHASRVHLERMVAFLGSARPGTRLELPGRLTLRRGRAPEYRLGRSGSREDAC